MQTLNRQIDNIDGARLVEDTVSSIIFLVTIMGLLSIRFKLCVIYCFRAGESFEVT